MRKKRKIILTRTCDEMPQSWRTSVARTSAFPGHGVMRTEARACRITWPVPVRLRQRQSGES